MELIFPMMPSNNGDSQAAEITTTRGRLPDVSKRSVDLIQALPAAVYTCDTEGYIDTFNEAALELWGRVPEPGKTRWCGSERIFSPEGDPLLLDDCPMAQTLRTGKPVRGQEVVIERPDGSRRHVLPYPNLLHDEVGNVIGAVNMLVDISDRKKAEEERALASRLPFENPSPVLRLNDGRTIGFANPAASGILEFWQIDIGGQVPEGISGEADEVLASGERRIVEMSNGGRLYQVSLVPVSSPRSVNLYFNDITSRKSAEVDLGELTLESGRKRRLYEGLLSTTPDLAYVFDLNHRFTYANEALLAMWGRTWDESIGKNCLELGYEPWHAAMHGREIDEIIVTKRPIRGDVPFFHETLGRRIYDYILTPVIGADGEVEAIAGITRDVTDQKIIADRAEFLSELTGKLAPLTKAREIIATTVKALGERLHAQRCYFLECEPEKDLLVVRDDWASGDIERIAGSYSLHDFGDSEWWREFVFGKFSVEDVRTNPLTANRQDSYIRLGVISYAVQPFHQDGDRTVTLAVTSDAPRRWTDDELSLLDHVVARVWPLIERARSELALRDSRRQLRLVSDHVPALISYLDRNEVFRFANGKYHEWFGVKPADLRGKPLKNLLDPATYQQRAPYVARVLQGQSVKFEGPTRHRDFGWRDLELSYVPDFGPDKTVRGFYVMAADITERKRAEHLLERQARRLKLLWETAGIILTSENPDIMLQRVFGKVSNLLEVDAFFNFMVNETGDALELRSCHGIAEDDLALIARLEFGQAVCGTVARRREPMVECSIQDSESPLVRLVKGYGIRCYACNPLMAGDELLGTLSFASRTRDSFEPDEIEFIETISHYITGAYVRWRLMEDLRAGDRRKDEFLATLAHELRNPLAPIRTGLEVMRMAGENPVTVEKVRVTMERQVEQLVTLVNDLLDVSRITRGKLQLRTSRVQLAEAVRAAVETSRPVIDDASHVLIVRLPDQPVFLEADSHRLSQVISNLLNNAAKYTPRGGEIILSVESSVKGEVVLTVRDNGIGIPSPMLEKIFDMFTQIDSPAGGDYGGLGIGLTLVKSLVELHGGNVKAESDGPGKGSAFSLKLPVLMQTLPESEGRKTHLGTAADCGRRRVLVVDDNEAAAQTLAMAVELMGHHVKVAHNGRDGVDLAAEFRPEIVLMDLGMPVMNGWEAAIELRGKPWSEGMMIVALTGWGQEEDRKKTKDAGFHHHLVKPASPETIRELLDLLTRSPGIDTASIGPD